MDTQQMINIVHRLYEEGYSKGSNSVCKELCDSHLKLHDPTLTKGPGGIEALIGMVQYYHQAFPNLNLVIDDIIAAGNKVIVFWTFQGKHEGELRGIPATYKKISLSGISIYQFNDDKITEMWQAWDRLTLFDQLGVKEPQHVY